MSNEFDEIGHTGGKLEFIREDKGLSFQYSQSSDHPVTIYQVAVSLEGKILGRPAKPLDFAIADRIPGGGLIINAFVVSDKNGMFGRTCRNCNSYFRVDHPAEPTYCPYCNNKNDSVSFLTENQIKFIEIFCNTFLETYNGNESITIDLDELSGRLENNKSAWVYMEEKQQTQHECAGCKCKFDILGEYGKCPQCNRHNALEIFTKKIENIEQEFTDKDKSISKEERQKRENEWKSILSNCVAVFDGLGNEIRKHLLYFQFTDKRRNDVRNLSFQRVQTVYECLKPWFDIDIFKDMTEDDKSFINKMFNKRHIISHNNGKVDEEYLKNTGDNVKLGQTIRVRSNEINRLIPLLKIISQNLITGFQAIKYE